MRRAFTNAIIFTGETVERDKAILVEGDTIAGIVSAKEIPGEYQQEDIEGFNICPSFIDLQVYGGNGKMFSHELSVASLQSTYEYCLNGGAAHFMITMATNAIEKLLTGIDVVSQYWNEGGKGLLGLHLEGPYLNPLKKGAHIEQYIKKPVSQEIELLFNRQKGVIKMMTIAPEMCDGEIIDLLLNKNIIVSAGHTNASYQQGMHAFDKGIPAATHLFNAMSPFQSREPGMVGSIYDHPDVMSSVVCDGVHVDFAAIRISKQLMKERLFFITDAVAEVKEGAYCHLFKGDRYTLPDGTLSGSSLTMMKCIENAIKYVGIPLEEALRMASTYPAKLLNASCKLGKIEKGFMADFVVFDEELNIKRTIVS